MVIRDNGQLVQVQTAALFGTKLMCFIHPEVFAALFYTVCGGEFKTYVRLQIIHHCAVLNFHFITLQ